MPDSVNKRVQELMSQEFVKRLDWTEAEKYNALTKVVMALDFSDPENWNRVVKFLDKLKQDQPKSDNIED